MFESRKQRGLKLYFSLKLKITQQQINRKTLLLLFFQAGIGFRKVIIQQTGLTACPRNVIGFRMI